MKLNKPKFWDTKISFISILLFPISLIVLIFIFLKKKFTKTIRFNIPIICVGNIYLGGTGKTPTSIFLGNELTKIGKKPVILRKFYNGHEDEYNLIKKYFKNLIIRRNRDDGIKEAEKKNFDSIILDDGFQDYKIKKDINILCFNQNQLIGNGLIVPSGPLRESISSLKNANIILINGKENKNFEKKIFDINNNLKVFYSYYKPINLERFRNKKLFAIAGIGNPENFFQLIEENNLYIEKKLAFPDHYQFTKNEIKNIINEAKNLNCQIIMTEKDYFKIKDYNVNDIDYLNVALEVIQKEKFIKTVARIYDQKN
ncbi:tetraacyldisaccharide 4'-kinase [Pelagibacteraceae bacterium]|nr:tetraacyldisaccharide 4'-kinase [Pelagibacteraceae bacterium]